jgi:Zincin-like metallopeptidase
VLRTSERRRSARSERSDEAGAPLSWTSERADTSLVCERERKAAASERQPLRAERAIKYGAIKKLNYSAHVSSHRRDRHGRGLRGPLALPNSLSRRRAQPPHPASRADFFTDAVQDAVDRVGLQCPDVLVGITFGIEDVPHFDMAWSGDQVPLAAALEGTEDQPGQVVVYRRPLEHRAVSRRGLRILVYRTIVEQLAALTGRSIEDIDPDAAGNEDD